MAMNGDYLAPIPDTAGSWVWRPKGARRALDDVVADIERRWGFERLPRLVSPKLRERFVAAQDMHRQATMAGEDMAEMDAMMIRAWRALEAEALSRGQTELPGAVVTWQAEEPERGTICLCLDDEHAQALLARAKAEGVNVETWTLAEVGRVVKAATPLAEIKQAFPGATVQGKRKPFPADEIPI
jgi:choline dehydrogenase-like flavoprotein